MSETLQEKYEVILDTLQAMVDKQASMPVVDEDRFIKPMELSK